MIGKKIAYYVQSFLKFLSVFFIVVGVLSLVAAIIFWLLNNDIFVLFAVPGVISIIFSLVFLLCFLLVKKISPRYISAEELNQMQEVIVKQKIKEALSYEDYLKRVALLFKKIGAVLVVIFLVFLLLVGLAGVVEGVGGLGILLGGLGYIVFSLYVTGFLFIANLISLTYKFLSNRSKQRMVSSQI
ncbi:MAG: hypothetical protein A2937_04045 [Candidatus Yonathbacteria bacterium RIFCSPLOWO2_01_FULL_47_33b]|uniref:Uncharacterized protein n=1 Tax=Candidatus Yonathbacteria bacterium RIFCSPLOWO2_01_FULL_47_33b TaxID=1802727 RepID=A0A1G2SE91_9BACT|nr:MAG: hypothetical protein A2937_04045 [Candidatus Yonathbacteria bacterium RIFCSPLOWO2_01_FULL_47_33b]